MTTFTALTERVTAVVLGARFATRPTWPHGSRQIPTSSGNVTAGHASDIGSPGLSRSANGGCERSSDLPRRTTTPSFSLKPAGVRSADHAPTPLTINVDLRLITTTTPAAFAACCVSRATAQSVRYEIRPTLLAGWPTTSRKRTSVSDCSLCDGDVLCLRHKLAYWRERGMQVSPSATPSRRNTVAPRTPNNAWERGVPRDSRGMPVLNPDLTPMGAKQFAENRSRIEESRRRAHQAPAPTE